MWPNPQSLLDLVTFTKEILNGKLHFLCNVTFIFCAGLINWISDVDKYTAVNIPVS